MKYIVIEVSALTDTELKRYVPIIFPNYLVHKQVWQALQRLPDFNGRIFKARVRSAGEVRFDDHGRACCFGGSETLGVSVHDNDETVINGHDYHHGLI